MRAARDATASLRRVLSSARRQTPSVPRAAGNASPEPLRLDSGRRFGGGRWSPPAPSAIGWSLVVVVVCVGLPAGAQWLDLQALERGVAAVGEQFDPVAGGVGEDLVGEDGLAVVGEDLD
jgi:hypothetical protein